MNIAPIAINLPRLLAEIEALSLFSDAPPPAVTRILYTPVDLASRRYLQQLVEEAGFTWRVDAIGNTFIRWPGRDPSLPAVATGSHCDAVPFAGKYDGVVGVLGGLEAMRSLKEAGVQPQRSLELILFTAEEPTRFGLGCVGSRALAGVIAPHELSALRDSAGEMFDEVRQAAGFTGDLASVALAADHYAAFVELHIEQGPLLEAEGIPIGVVTGVAASSTITVNFYGDGGHAGTVLMTSRRDPLPAAAELALQVEQTARFQPGGNAVATVGIFEVHPGASNSIPSRVQMSIDVRDVELWVRDQMVAEFRQSAAQIAEHRGITHDFHIINADPALRCDSRIVGAAVAAAQQWGLPYKKLVSRAYHDTVFMGRICPVGMIFVPSRGGYSHRPEEYTAPAEIGNGVQVLALTLATLAEA